ncbi:MAG: transcriptional repressor [Actinomycetia bacterium]|nr:transcriptional repressor [Actinomycetes bacterium]
MKRKKQDLIANLKKQGHRITPQRKKLLELFKTVKGHLSAEEIHELSKKKGLNISLATIYRNLDLFKKIGVMNEEDFGDGKRRFEISSQHHHHLICLTCGKIQELNDPLLDNFEKKLENNSRFKITDHRLEFYGYCPQCKKKIK